MVTETPVSSIFPMSVDRRVRTRLPSQRSDSDDFGIVNERVIFLVFQSMKWDIHGLCMAASVNRKLRAIVKRLLWRELCAYHAPRMITSLESSAPGGRIGGGWHTIAKLMFFCGGCEATRNFKVSRPTPGHFVKTARFSKTSGKSFLTKKCRGDLFYVSDPCEHPMGEKEYDLGIFRGIFKGFPRSRTIAYLIRWGVDLEERVRCPYCAAPVWSMTTAGLVPKSAARRLGSHDGALEYFVCAHGHMHGTCWLEPLSSDENEENDGSADDDDDGSADDDDDDDDDDGGVRGIRYDDRTVMDESMGSTSMGEEVVEDGPAK